MESLNDDIHAKSSKHILFGWEKWALISFCMISISFEDMKAFLSDDRSSVGDLRLAHKGNPHARELFNLSLGRTIPVREVTYVFSEFKNKIKGRAFLPSSEKQVPIDLNPNLHHGRKRAKEENLVENLDSQKL